MTRRSHTQCARTAIGAAIEELKAAISQYQRLDERDRAAGWLYHAELLYERINAECEREERRGERL